MKHAPASAVLVLLGGIAAARAAPASPLPPALPEPVATAELGAVEPNDGDLTDFGIEPGARPLEWTGGTEPPPAPVTGVERVAWTETPIRITLPVGVERQVRFPGPVRIGLPATLDGQRLRTQIVSGTVYWLAHAPFAPVRAQAREVATGRTYLLDLDAAAGAATAPVQIALPAEPLAVAPAGAAASPPAPPRYDAVQLTRFAVQQLYAPERLLKPLPGVRPVPVRRRPEPLVEGGAVEARPEAAWTDGALYVTAVRLTNRTREPVVLDPRRLRGRWLARTLLYSVLQPTGDPQVADTALVFLLSPQPFEETH